MPEQDETETRLRMNANEGLAIASLGQGAELMRQTRDFDGYGTWLGKAASAINICLQDAMSLAPDGATVKKAFDAAVAGADI